MARLKLEFVIEVSGLDKESLKVWVRHNVFGGSEVILRQLEVRGEELRSIQQTLVALRLVDCGLPKLVLFLRRQVAEEQRLGVISEMKNAFL